MARSEVADHPLFASVSEESLALVEAAGVIDVPAGQVLARGGDVGEGMFVVLDGSVVAERGDLHLEMGPGAFVGELSLLVPDAPHVARVRATSDARVVAIPRETFDRLVETEPSFTLALLRELAARLVEARTGH
jgi:sigma-B regulation protein RsbU (phosphoserine phosphatase)